MIGSNLRNTRSKHGSHRLRGGATAVGLMASVAIGTLALTRDYASSAQAAVRADRGPEILLRDLAASPARKTMAVRVFLIALGDNGRFGRKVGCGDSLVAVTKIVPFTRAPLGATMRLLLADHHAYYGQSGLYNALYRARLTVKRAVRVNGKAIIHLVGRLSLGGECDDPRVRGQLRRTALQFPTVHGVAIFVNNIPLGRLLGGRGG
jgi:hypothetical protein